MTYFIIESYFMTRLLLLLTAITFSLPTIAQQASTHNTEPLLQFEMKVETDGIENALLENQFFNKAI